MSVKGLHVSQELHVVAAIDEHLHVFIHQLWKHGESVCVELLLLPLLQLLGHYLTLGLVEEAPCQTEFFRLLRNSMASNTSQARQNMQTPGTLAGHEHLCHEGPDMHQAFSQVDQKVA